MYLHCIVFVYLYNHNIARQRIALLREKQSGSERSPTETRIMVHPPPSHLAQLQTNDQIMKNTDERRTNKDKTSTILCFSYFVSGDPKQYINLSPKQYQNGKCILLRK